MNLSNLNPGQEVKNYRELCLLLEIKPVGGTSKMAQMKELKRYMDFEQITGTKRFQIYSIFDVPKEAEMHKSNAVFMDSMVYCLLSYLGKKANKREKLSHVRVSIYDLYIMLGFCTEYYHQYKGDLEGLWKEYHEVEYQTNKALSKMEAITTLPTEEEAVFATEFKLFYRDGGRLMHRLLNNLIQAIQLRELVVVSEVYYIKTKNKFEKHYATEDQNILIKTTKGKIIHTLGFKNMGEVISSGKYNTFIKELDLELKEKFDILWNQKHYRFSFQSDLDKTIEKYKHLFSLPEQAKLHTNDNVVENILRKGGVFRKSFANTLLSLREYEREITELQNRTLLES